MDITSRRILLSSVSLLYIVAMKDTHVYEPGLLMLARCL